MRSNSIPAGGARFAPSRARRRQENWVQNFGCTLGLAFAAVSGSCTRSESPEDQVVLTIFAAASCTQVVSELSAEFTGGRARHQFAGSSALARQIADGAPADVFVSASTEWKDYLVDRGLVAGEPVAFAKGSLVCIVSDSDPWAQKGSPAESPTKPMATPSTPVKTESDSGTPLPKPQARPQTRPVSLSTLASQWSQGERIAIANRGVPAGEYARQAIESSGLAEALTPDLVGLSNVRTVYQSVRRGEARVGLVYATEAQLPGVRPLFSIDPALHEPIQFWACPVANPNSTRGTEAQSHAQEYLQFLQSPSGRSILERHSFE